MYGKKHREMHEERVHEEIHVCHICS